MAMTELKTRIALRYDTYTNWTSASGKSLVLLKGEVGICEIPSGSNEATTAPTILFKVGDGQRTFEQLSWISAKAADVYSWAKAKKAEDVMLTVNTGTSEVPVETKITLENWLINYYASLESISNQFTAVYSNFNNINQVIENLNTEIVSAGDFVTSVTQSAGKVTVTKGDVTSDKIKMPAFKDSSSQNTSTLKAWTSSCEDDLTNIRTELNKKVTSDNVSTAISTQLGQLTLAEPTISESAATAFIDTISQTKGKITATRKKLPTASTTTAGIVQLDNAAGAASYSTVS